MCPPATPTEINLKSMKRVIRVLNEIFFSILKIKNFWVYLLCRSRSIADKIVTIKLRNGISYNIEPGKNQAPMIKEIWHLNIYDPLLKFVKEGSTIIDIGANIGVFSIKAAKKAANVRVFSFEPFPGNFSVLKNNISLNHLDGVIRAFPLAVDSSLGEKEFFFRPNDSGGGSFRRYGDKSELLVTTVKTTTLSKIFEENSIQKCDFIKMDCEGAEEEIILTTPQDLFGLINSITLEWHADINKTKIEDFRNFLETVGYKTEYDHSVITLYAWRESSF